MAADCERANRLAEAEQIYRGILTQIPNSVQALYGLGMMALRAGHADAIGLLQQCVALDPNYPDSWNNLGVALQNRGEIDKAIECYRRAIAIRPDYSEGCNNLGNALQCAGRLSESIEWYRRAIAVRPEQVEAHYNLGNALQESGQPDAAIEAFQKSLQVNPRHFQAMNNLGVALQKRGNFEGAIEWYRRALAIQPDYVDSQHNLGTALSAAGRTDEAIAVLQQTIARRPNHAETYVSLGSALAAGEKFNPAIACFGRAIELHPTMAEAWDGLGLVYKSQNRLDEALACFRRATEVRPTFAEGFTHMGNVRHRQNRFDDAIDCYFKAIEVAPDAFDAHSNLGACLPLRGRIDEAIEHCGRAIAMHPERPEAHVNLGTAMLGLGRFDEAIDLFRHAISINPDMARAHFNLALALLSCGQFDEGWREYEWRWKMTHYLPSTPRDFKQPPWDGAAAPPGGTLLLHAEQGLGDTIQFVRFIPRIRELGWQVLLECQPSLLRLFGGQDWLAGVRLIPMNLEARIPSEPFDAQLPLVSLPLVMKAPDPHSPAWPRDPYLRAEAGRSESWRRELAAMDGLKIGISWAGSPTHHNDFNRSIPLSMLAPLARSGARFFSFQFGPAAAQAAAPPPGMELIDWTGRIEDFADSAALVEQMDLIITVDTALAHLAGAMGKPVWVLLPFVPDFRWMLEREDTPLYPNMRLFRQDRRMDWTGAIDRVAAALSDKCKRP